jgi:hypothetical protein
MTFAVKKMPTPQGIGAGQTASINLPLGLTYTRLMIRARATIGGSVVDLAPADWGTVFDELRLMVNGDSQITIDAADLVALNQYYDEAPIDGVLPLFLSRPWMRTIGGEDQTSYGTVGMDSFSFEIDVKAGQTIGLLEVYAVQSAATVYGPHLRVQRYTRNQGVTGPAEIADIVRGPYAMLALHVNTAAIGSVEVVTDGRKIIESDKQIRDAHGDVAGRIPQTDMTHIDFLTENRLQEALPMALQDFRLKLDFTETGNFSIYAESLTSPN